MNPAPMSEADAPKQASASASIPFALAGLIFAIYLLTASGHLYLGDAWASLRTAESMVTRGALDVPFDDTFGGKFAKDNKFYVQYGPGVMVHDLVPAVVGRVLSHSVHSDGARKLAFGLPAS